MSIREAQDKLNDLHERRADMLEDQVAEQYRQSLEQDDDT